MFYLACISFNNKTYDENICYRNKSNKKVIYGSMLKIREIYPKESLIFIAEMNVNENKIEGIGLIKNIIVYNRTHKIHDNNECNRYIYLGKYWLSRTQILEADIEILNIFDDILFKGKSHLKNRIGIRIITDNLFVNWSYDLITLKNKVKNVFLLYFQKKERKEKYFEEEEEYFEIVPNIKKKEEEEEEEEYFEIEIDDITYYTNNEENGIIYEVTKEEEVGKKVGYIKEIEPYFY